MPSKKLLNILIPLFIFVGMLTRIPFAEKLGLTLSLVAQIVAIIDILNVQAKRVKNFALCHNVLKDEIPLFDYASSFKAEHFFNKKLIHTYLISLALIASFFVSTITLGHPISLAFNRCLNLTATFGIAILSARKGSYELKTIVNRTVNLFCALAVVIIFDAILFATFRHGIWPPINYLGFRFCGPFYDANFFGISYAIILLILLFLDIKDKEYKILISALAILAAGSWSTIGALIVVIVAYAILNPKIISLFLKQLLILALDLFAIFCYFPHREYVFNLVINLLVSKSLTFAEAHSKYNSMNYRLTAQHKALELIPENPLGAGPHSIVDAVGRDTHNSFLGIIFEQGIFGLGLLLINYRSDHKQPRAVAALSSFLILMAITINIHYSTIAALILLLIHNKESHEVFNHRARL